MKTKKRRSTGRYSSFGQKLILLVLLLVGMGHGQRALAQCCPVTTLRVSTGYNPATNSALPPGSADPRWIVNFNSPSVCQPCGGGAAPIGFSPVAPGGNAWVVPTGLVNPNGNAISCVNSNFYNTDGITPGGTQYYTDFKRQFTLCVPSAVTLNLGIASDNGVDVYIDPVGTPPVTGGTIIYSLPVGVGFNAANWSAFNPMTFTTGVLGSGTHTIYVRAYQYNHIAGTIPINNFYLNIDGTVTSSVPNNIIPEALACTGWSFCSAPPITGLTTCCVGDSKTLSNTNSGGTWSSSNPSVASINPSTGIYTGMSAGTAVITYTDPCGHVATINVTINPAPVITGLSSVCVGSTISLSGSPGGGTWSSSAPSKATVSPGGVVTGVASGTAVITYTAPTTGCTKTKTITVNPIPAITGSHTACIGTSLALTASPSGGTWSSSNTGIATVTSGTVNGVSPGSAIITYVSPAGCTTTHNVTVSPPPAPVSGPAAVCAGSTITVTDPTPGGTWSSSNTLIATVNSAGVVTGVAAGSVAIVYTLPTGCKSFLTITVNASPIITGPAAVCVGSTITLSASIPGGLWSSSDNTIASVSGGIVTGNMTGTVIITYVTPAGCSGTQAITVNPLPDPIAGPGAVCVGSTIALVDPTPGGTWSSSPTSIATIGSGSGIVTGVSGGTATITYQLPTGCKTTMPVIVNPIPTFSYPPLCMGGTYAPTGVTPPGGSWSSSNPAVASIDAVTGVITSGVPGTATITYISPAGCQVSHVVTVNPLPKPVIGLNSTPSPDLCIGQSAILVIDAASVPGCTLVWSSSNTAIATVSPATGTTTIVTAVSAGSVTITCTVTSTATGCSTPVTFPIIVHPNPSLTITSVPGAVTIPGGLPAPKLVMACPDAVLTANCSTPVLYAWSPTTGMTPPSGTTATVTVTPAGLTVYTVIVYDSLYKCASRDSIAVMPVKNSCVCNAQSNNIPVIPFALSGTVTMATAGLYPAGNYYMQNNVTIGGVPGDVVTLTGCVIFIDPGLSISVAPGVKLVLDNCHLFCCNPDMWRGIILNTTFPSSQGLIELRNNTMIEDAVVAIDVPTPAIPAGGALVINSHGAIFNKNTIGINISNFNPAITPVLTPTSGYPYPVVQVPCYPFVIENTVFTSRNFYPYNIAGPITPANSWPYKWPGTNTPDGLKTPWIPAGPYDPPYNIDNPSACATGGYAFAICNNTNPADKGIQFTNVGATTGSLGSATYSGTAIGTVPTTPANLELNMFDNLSYGIYATNSNIVPRNGTYIHLAGSANLPGGATTAGIGIYAVNTNPPGYNNKYLLWLYGSDGSLVPKKGGVVATSSSFYDCSTAVNAKEYYYVKGEFAKMMSTHGASPTSTAGTAGYDVSSSNYYDVQLNYNNIYNITTGIIHVASPPVGTPLYGEVEVKGNNISAANPPVAPTMGEYVRQAIIVSDVAGGGASLNIVPGTQVNIEYNHLDHVLNGIFTDGFSMQVQPVICNDNVISIDQDLIFTPMAPQTGIRFNNINPGYIQNNTVSGPGSSVPTPPSHMGLNYNYPIIEGVHVGSLFGAISSIQSTVGCNQVSDLNTGFFFENFNGISWINNIMNKNAYGYVVSGAIGNQVGTGINCNNQWLPASGFWLGVGPTPNYQTYTMGTADPSWSKLYVSGAIGFTPTEHGTEAPAVAPYSVASTVIYAPSGSPMPCPVLPATSVGFKQGNNDNDNTGVSLLDKITGEQGYVLYPNPSDGHISIRQQLPDSEPVRIEIWNATGQVVYKGQLQFENSEVHLDTLAGIPGVYLLKLADHAGKTTTIKFTVQQ